MKGDAFGRLHTAVMQLSKVLGVEPFELDLEPVGETAFHVFNDRLYRHSTRGLPVAVLEIHPESNRTMVSITKILKLDEVTFERTYV